ncbi:MAG: AI-2E family transporter [Clostridium sulfidigenes]|uniref:AI-2E family transporter n=1 Tax=Clostridium sulfidigenes TaxID=318464 RepID=A0A927WF98_9CLOT|nr:AI-2E family transporter [Clostridium sulfidigenes]
MKIKLNSNIAKRTISNIIVVSVGIILFFIIKNLGGIFNKVGEIIKLLMPFIYGFSIAYLLAIPLKFLEDKVLKFMDKKNQYKAKRFISITITYISAAILISIIFSILVPELSRSIYTLLENIPEYINALEEYINNIVIALNLNGDMVEDIVKDFNSISKYITSIAGTAVLDLFQFSANITQYILNIFIATIISIYLLAGKEKFFAQIKKFLYAMLPEKPVKYVIELTRSSHKTFIGFLGGKLLDSLIIGIICFVGMKIFKMPYPLLVSFIIGITNVVPVFGPFIGAVPSVIIIFIASPIKALWFILFILVLQQFDGNILGPKILGNSTGLTAFWVMFAILLGNGLFGVVGMILGVPTFAVIYSIIVSVINNALKEKGLPVEAKEYAAPENKIKF